MGHDGRNPKMMTGARARKDQEDGAGAHARVTVVIPAYNHAQFLAHAIDSIVSQTVTPSEVIVVDDGSADNPGAVVAQYPSVRLIAQANEGPASARNVGLRAASSELVLFLDADDVLCPSAIEAGLNAMRQTPGAGFVYGAYCLADNTLTPTSEPQFQAFGSSAYHALLLQNVVRMHSTVLYDRAKLLECGGFDESLRRCEDYDVFLRLARKYPVGCHPEVVALYRLHAANTSSDPVEMLHYALDVQARHKPQADDAAAMRAWHSGRRFLKVSHANEAWKERQTVAPEARRGQRRQLMRSYPGASVTAAAWQALKTILPRPAARWARNRLQRLWLPVGGIDMGHLARTTPISRKFGYDRGTPVDRYYIEGFLERHREDISGRVVEVGEALYSKRFGHDISRQDVLHISAGHPAATIVGDLSQPGVLPEAAFDCMIVTQTLHLIPDMAAAIEEMRQALKPGGVLLLTVPGVSSVERGEWGPSWMWSLTGASAEQLFSTAFEPDNVTLEVHGNVYAATCFLHGLALEEVRADWLDRADPTYPVIVAVRARRGE